MINTSANMDSHVMDIVFKYILNHLDKSDEIPYFEVYIVWKCKTLQNWKYLISSTLMDGMYYELTYNGDTNEWYLDAYKKFENKVIPGDAIKDANDAFYFRINNTSFYGNNQSI